MARKEVTVFYPKDSETLQALSALQAERGLTSKAFAAFIGLGESHWCHIRNGRRRVSRRAVELGALWIPDLWERYARDVRRGRASVDQR